MSAKLLGMSGLFLPINADFARVDLTLCTVAVIAPFMNQPWQFICHSWWFMVVNGDY
jgi:hypothetical protein